MYISQNQIGSKVHSQNSPSLSKEVHWNTCSDKMQALIPFIGLIVACSGTQLTLLPYAYLAEPLPIYHQSQNTRTGEHAYSYAGGPSAKEEVKGLDGVTRGSYSYIDANGILQSVFYVADEGGFRVAATNLPSNDQDLSFETSEVLLAKNSEEQGINSRRKRSLEDSNQNSNQNRQEEKDATKGNIDQSPAESVHTLVYQTPDSLFIPKLLATATSHQSQVQIHRNVQLEPEKLVKIEEPVIISAEQLPTATSHQSQVQIHKNLRLEVPDAEVVAKAKEPVEVVHAPLSPIVPLAPITAYSIESLPLLPAFPSYHENRIQLHKSLGIEGNTPVKDAVKIKTEPVTLVETPVAAVPVVPSVLTKESLPVVVKEAVPLVKEIPLAIEPATATVTTTVSSHGVTQIHGDSKVRLPASIFSEPALLLKSPVVPQLQPLVNLPLIHALPYARAAHYRTQIHSN